MGCGSSSATVAKPVARVSQANVDQRDTRTPSLASNVFRRVPSSSSDVSDTKSAGKSTFRKTPERVAPPVASQSFTSQ